MIIPSPDSTMDSPCSVKQLRKAFNRILKAFLRGEGGSKEDLHMLHSYGRAANIRTEGQRRERLSAPLYEAMVVLLLEASQVDRVP
jgi:hypothetical protein